ncbi:MAG: glycosyltransferase family 4 protein [Salinigranum sp.]
MFHPTAGSTSASGTAVFVTETVRELARRQPAYLYTQRGRLSADLRRSAVEVVEIERDPYWERLRRFAGRLPVNLRRISAQLSSSTSVFVNALLDGTVAHIERNVDVLFTHHMGEAMFLSNVVDVPVVRVMHGCRLVGIGAKTVPRVSRLAGTVANSRQTAAEMSEKLGNDADGIVYPGVRAEEFDPGRTPAFERDGFVVMFVGRFHESKGVYDLLEAFARLPEEARLSLVGRGDAERLRERIDSLGIGERVTVEGEVAHDRLPHYYVAADVACLPSHYESFGMANLEAMACGTPVVTTDLPGIREYATHGRTSLLVPPGDVDALAEGLSRLMASAELRERLGDAGRDVAERYSWRETAAGFSRFSEDVLERR